MQQTPAKIRTNLKRTNALKSQFTGHIFVAGS